MDLLERFSKRQEGPSKCYRTIYIEEELMQKVFSIAAECNASFNYVVTNMLQYCVDELDRMKKE